MPRVQRRRALMVRCCRGGGSVREQCRVARYARSERRAARAGGY